MSPYGPAGKPEVERLENELQELFTRYESYIRNAGSSPALASDLSKFVCVRICGFLEQGIATLAMAHVAARSAPTVIRFGSSWLSRMQNPKRGALISFVERFDHGWGIELGEWLDDADPAKSLDSLVQTRNDIAHGLSTGIGHDTLVRYLELVVDLVDWFEVRLS